MHKMGHIFIHVFAPITNTQKPTLCGIITGPRAFRNKIELTFGVVECQNRIKNGRVMPIQRLGKRGELAYFGPNIGHFGHSF